MVKISVILPIYNVEDYLEETLDCLLNQTIISDIEVLMIDDGSTDNSRYIIEKFALDYENFHAYHKVNEGQGIARNYGLEFAKGEYVLFLDSDDYIPYNSYEKLYNLASGNDSDIIIGDVLRFSNYNVWSDGLFKHSFEGLTHDIESTTLNQRPQLLWDTSTSNKLYKREFIEKNNIRFLDKKIFFEDLLFSTESYIKANSIYISNWVFYYWRFRGRKTSVTQQHSDIKNFYDRIEILHLIDKLMKDNGVSQDLIHYEYKKWLNHDLKIFLKKFNNYPTRFIQELINEVQEILEIIPDEFIDELDSFKRILYAMVNNNDIYSLLAFAHLEKEFVNNNFDFDNLPIRYVNLIDFKKDVLDVDLNVNLTNMAYNEEELFLKFSEKIGYLDSNYPHRTGAFLVVKDNNQFDLEIYDEYVVIPFALLKNQRHSNVKIVYESNDFVKEAFLTNKKRKSFEFDEFYVELGVGVDNLLFIDCLEKSDVNIEVHDVDYDEEYLIFKGKCGKDKVRELFIQNYVSFDTIEYPLIYIGDVFKLKIPFKDIFNVSIKKWELNCSKYFNSMSLLKEFNFYFGNNHIKVFEGRNKILIENNLCNVIEELNVVHNGIDKLNRQNRALVKDNKRYEKLNKKYVKSNNRLNDEIDEFKSRKAVKLVDRLKKL